MFALTSGTSKTAPHLIQKVWVKLTDLYEQVIVKVDLLLRMILYWEYKLTI